ncbi:MAG TPA: hypothetical protein V6D33_08010 [Cyanophyceae cyanobacterium]
MDSPSCQCSKTESLYDNVFQKFIGQIQISLLQRGGEAVIAQTQSANCTYLKFTLLNPRTTVAHLQNLLNSIKQLGEQLEEIN